VRVRFIGRRDRAPDDLRDRMDQLEEETRHNERLNLWIAFDSGGRDGTVQGALGHVGSGIGTREGAEYPH
jgi:undecaprenyl diphosphate synthase